MAKNNGLFSSPAGLSKAGDDKSMINLSSFSINPENITSFISSLHAECSSAYDGPKDDIYADFESALLNLMSFAKVLPKLLATEDPMKLITDVDALSAFSGFKMSDIRTDISIVSNFVQQCLSSDVRLNALDRVRIGLTLFAAARSPESHSEALLRQAKELARYTSDFIQIARDAVTKQTEIAKELTSNTSSSSNGSDSTKQIGLGHLIK